MSTLHAARPRPRTRPSRPSSLPLRLVAPVRSRASRAPFVVVVLTVLGAGLVGLILLSTVLQAQAFEIARLSSKADALTVQEQELRREVDRLQAPAALAERALRLGMVPNANPVFLRPGDGKVIGDPEPAESRSNVRRVDR
jgi:cell division protein FtsB